MAKMAKKEVLVIFKTHLDIGFTDYAANVIEKYMTQFIPNAIRVGYELKNTDTPFRWTTGSYLIWEALKRDETGEVEKAVRDGILNWHALPFTTHTELMNERLFREGLAISRKLDARFGRKTVGAKMTDVPGHTVGMLPALRDNGVGFLHIGVNPATPLPDVPHLFRWKHGNDSLVVMYQEDYGLRDNIGDTVLYFAHTQDNCGPQSAEEIVSIYRKIAAEYPGYTLRAATIDDIAERAMALTDLPLVEDEIGDTWIHGAATDPQKLSRYRKVLRHIEGMDTLPFDAADHLLLVPEHTWGRDLKKTLTDITHYAHDEMDALGEGARRMELSWEEQRDYVRSAETALGITPDYPVEVPDTALYTEVPLSDIQETVEISWELFGREDYERYKKDYMRSHVDWAIWDFTKQGLPNEKGALFTATPAASYKKENKQLTIYKFDEKATVAYGLPHFTVETEGEAVTVKWFGKKPSRLPQAFWLKFKGMEEKWELSKMGGLWVKPDRLIGSPFISAIDKGVRGGSVCIESLDAALVAPYGRRLLRYGEERGSEDLYFNLYNNIWNTNFPMWYGDDGLFRFILHKTNKARKTK